MSLLLNKKKKNKCWGWSITPQKQLWRWLKSTRVIQKKKHLFLFTSSPMMVRCPTLYDGGNGHHGFFFFEHGFGEPVHSICGKRRKIAHRVHFGKKEKKIFKKKTRNSHLRRKLNVNENHKTYIGKRGEKQEINDSAKSAEAVSPACCSDDPLILKAELSTQWHSFC